MPDIFVAKPKNKRTAQVKKEGNTKFSSKTSAKADVSFSAKGGSFPHIFSSFSKNPDDMTFQNQEVGEKIIFFVRKHFITNLPWIFIGILLLIVPLFTGVVISLLNIPVSILPSIFYFFFILFYYLIVVSYLFVNFITWFFNIALVTNIRVIDVDFTGLVYKNVAATKISLVQDVSYDQIGVLRTIFDYGDVLVQTAGTMDNFIFEAVPQPENIVHLVGDLIGKDNNV